MHNGKVMQNAIPSKCMTQHGVTNSYQ